MTRFSIHDRPNYEPDENPAEVEAREEAMDEKRAGQFDPTRPPSRPTKATKPGAWRGSKPDSPGDIPAFPTTPEGETIPGVQGGMTLRDWFAGQALAGMWASSEAWITEAGYDDMASHAYEAADAMLAEREAP